MSYTPTTWTTGDTITATKLNKMEQGIASAGGGTRGLVTDTSDTLDKSYNELLSMLTNGTIPFIVYEANNDVFAVLRLQRLYLDDGSYYAEFSGGDLGDPFDRFYASSTANGQMSLD